MYSEGIIVFFITWLVSIATHFDILVSHIEESESKISKRGPLRNLAHLYLT